MSTITITVDIQDAVFVSRMASVAIRMSAEGKTSRELLKEATDRLDRFTTGMECAIAEQRNKKRMTR